MRMQRRDESSSFVDWLHSSLHQQNDDMLRAAVPDELVHLVEECDRVQELS